MSGPEGPSAMPDGETLARQELETDLSVEDLVYERALRTLGRVEPRSLREWLA